QRIAGQLKATSADVEDKLARALQRTHELEKQLAEMGQKLASSQSGDLAGQARDIGDVKVVVQRIDGADRKTLMETVDALKSRLQRVVIVLAAVDAGRIALVASVSKTLAGELPAGQLVNFVAQQVGGKGGGRPDMAQAGGNEPEKLAAALDSVADWVAERAGESINS